MQKSIISALIVGAVMATAIVAYSHAQQQPPNNAFRYFTTPLDNNPSRIVRLQSVTMPAYAGTEFHRHPGDQWEAIQEGEITYTIKGQPPRLLKAGDSVHIPRGAIHRNQNLSDRTARSIELHILDRDKPATEAVPE